MVTGTASEQDLIRCKGLEDEATLCGQQIALNARKELRKEMAERTKTSYGYGKTKFESFAERTLFEREMIRAFNEEMGKDSAGLPQDVSDA